MSADPRHPGGDRYTPRDRRPVDVAYAEDHGSPGIGESRDPDQLQDEIELLQNRMADRLDRVSSAFTPQNMIAQVTGEKNPDIFTTIDTVADAARRNPFAAAMIGAGLAQLVFASRKKLPEPDPSVLRDQRAAYGVEGVTADGRRFAPSGVRDAEGRLPEHPDYAGPDPRYASADIGDPDVDDRADDPDTIEGVENRVRRLQDRAAARLSAATHALGDAYDEGRARLRGTYESARARFASDHDDPYERPGPMDWVRENPVAIGLGALAMGALAAGYYTASRPSPRLRPLPRDRALAVPDDQTSVREEYRERREPAPMPVSAAAPAPMGAGMTRTAAIGGSGQMAGVTAPSTSAGASRPAARTTGSAPSTATSSVASTSAASSSSATRPTSSGSDDGVVRTLSRAPRGEAPAKVDDASESTVELTRVYPRG